MSKAEAGKVYLVGAGPGDPDLLTLKAARLLAEAGVVLHDDLVPQSILNLAGKQALIISVGKRCGRKKITQAAIHDLMIVSARRGLGCGPAEVRRPHDFRPCRRRDRCPARGGSAL